MKPLCFSPSRRAVVLAGSIALLLSCGFLEPDSQAANTWDGGGANGKWSTGLNWDNDAVPAFPQPLTFAGAANLITLNDLAGVTLNGIAFDAGADVFTLGGNAVTLNGAILNNSIATETINLPLTLNATQTVDVVFGGRTVIGAGANGSGVISGTGGLLKTGGGTLFLDAINTYTGETIVDGGSVVFGKNNTVGTLAFGAPTTAPFSTNSSSLDLSDASLTASSLDVRTSSSNTIAIGAGKTLTINGAVNIGPSTVGLVTSGINTRLDVSGKGALVVATSGNMTIAISRGNAEAGTDPFATLDLSGLNDFTYNAGVSAGELRVGGGNARGALILANTSNTITAAQVRVSDSGVLVTGAGNNNGGTSSMALGTGTNVINAGTILIGAGKSPGVLNFRDPALGTVTMAGQAGGASTVNITVGTASSATGSTATSQFQLAGHKADIQAGTVIIGRMAGATGGTGGGNMTFDTGTFTVSSLQIAVNSSGTAANGAVGTLIMGGDIPNSAATGVLNVSNQFFLANRTTTAASPARGSFILNGGTANINTDILDASTTGDASTRITSLTLSGGTLNMMGHNIGSATAPIGTLTFTSGILKNVSEINGGAGLTFGTFETDLLVLDGVNSYTGTTTINAGTLQVGTGADSGSLGIGPVVNNGVLAFNRTGTLVVGGPISGNGTVRKSGAGTVTLSGANSYAGATAIDGGTLSVTGSVASAINLNSGGTLSGAGNGVATGKVGSVIMAAGSSLSPGATGAVGDTGTLTLASLLINGGDIPLDLSDLINVTGTATFSGASTLTPNPNTPGGTYTILTAGALVLTTPPTVIPPTATRKTFVSDFSTANTIKLVVTGNSLSLAWTGANGSNWNIGPAGTVNWNNGAIAERFFNADTVLFSNGPVNRNIVITDITVQPGAVVVNNSAGNDYTITGNGGIGGGAALAKSGTGALTLASINSYSGGTTLNAGTLNINHATALGTGIFSIAGGSLDSTAGVPVTVTTNNRQAWNADVTFIGTNNLNLGSGEVTLSANRLVSVGARNLTIGGAITGAGALTKTGAGALTLAGANSFSGGVTLEAGTLNLNHAAALGTGAFTIANGTIDNTSGAPVTLAATAQNWNGNFTFTGTNPLNLGSGAVALGADRTVTVAASTLTADGVISGAGALIKAGPGVLRLNGANPYAGATMINAGTLLVTNAAGGNSSLGSLSGGAVTIATGATLDLSGNATAQALNFGLKRFNVSGTGAAGSGGAIVNNGVSQLNALQNVGLTGNATFGGAQRFDIRSVPTTALNATFDMAGFTFTKEGTNQFTLVGTNVSDGNIVVNQGLFACETVTTIPDFGTGKTITFNAGTTGQFFNLSGPILRPIVANGGVTFGNASAQASTLGSPITLNGDVVFTNLNNSTGALTIEGALSEIGGTRSISKTGATTLILTGANSYSGTTTIAAGRLQVGNGGAAGTLGSGAVLNNATLAFNRADAFSVASVISGAGSLVKEGVGVATLSGNSSYSGATTVSDGILLVRGSLSGTSSVNVDLGTLRLGAANRLADAAPLKLANGIFDTNGFNESVGSLTLSGVARLELGTGSSVMRFSDSAGIAWAGELSITNWSGLRAGGGIDQVIFGGTALIPEQVALIKFVDPFGPGSGIIGATMLKSGEIVAVPEPAAFAALLAGIGTLLLGRRRFAP